MDGFLEVCEVLEMVCKVLLYMFVYFVGIMFMIFKGVYETKIVKSYR